MEFQRNDYLCTPNFGSVAFPIAIGMVPKFKKSLIFAKLRASSKKNEIKDFCFFGNRAPLKRG